MVKYGSKQPAVYFQSVGFFKQRFRVIIVLYIAEGIILWKSEMHKQPPAVFCKKLNFLEISQNSQETPKPGILF